MSILTVHYVSIQDQCCAIIKPENQNEFAIVKENVVTIIDDNEFQFYNSFVKCKGQYFGYLGYITHTNENKETTYFQVFIKNAQKIGIFSSFELYRITELCFYNNSSSHAYLCSEKSTNLEESMKSLIDFGRLVTNGLFFYAYDYRNKRFHNLSVPFDATHEKTLGRDYFLWNRGMLISFKQATKNHDFYITSIVNGSLELQSLVLTAEHLLQPRTNYPEIYRRLIDLQADPNSNVRGLAKSGDVYVKILIISRLSWARAGTRFLARGLNDDGFAANFVETEQVILIDDVLSSFMQLRGSVPLFWSQSSMGVGGHKFDFSREKILHYSAFNKHFNRLLKGYYNVLNLSLLSSKKDEGVLNTFYKDVCKDSGLNLSFFHLDFNSLFNNAALETNWQHIPEVKNFLVKNMFHLSINGDNEVLMVSNQKGVIRTNCVDCLDRTNSFQTLIGLTILEQQIFYMGLVCIDSLTFKRLQESLKILWTLNGNNCSKNYAGTDALEKNKSSVQSFIKDTHTSIKRALVSNFSDARRNSAIDRLCNINQPIFLFREPYQMAGVNCIPEIVRSNSWISHEMLYELIKNVRSYTDTEDLKFHFVTWNVAGGLERVTTPSIIFSKDLQKFLLDSPSTQTKYHLDKDTTTDEVSHFDIIIVGLQEMVDLTASNILYYNDTHLKTWQDNLARLISRDEKYEAVTSMQLVGVALFIFSKVRHIDHIKSISTSYVKTGLGGTAGNKGGIGVSIKLYNSRICFVCAHFAAGNTANNIQQRFKDFSDISQQLVFDRDKGVFDHDYVFWLGDLNFRINVPTETAKNLADRCDIQTLIQNDQLYLGMHMLKVFQNFMEGKINFLPTYKYDFYSDNFDSSEKARTPSYTDRILWWQSDNELLLFSNSVCQPYYGRGEINVSDHRPVSSVFDVSVRVLDPNKFLSFYMNMIDKSPCGQITIQYSLSSTDASAFDLQSLISKLAVILPPFQLYRFERNVISLTFSYIPDVSKIPTELVLLKSVPFKELESEIIKILQHETRRKNGPLQKKTHTRKYGIL